MKSLLGVLTLNHVLLELRIITSEKEIYSLRTKQIV